MKAKVFVATGGMIKVQEESESLEAVLNQFLADVKKVHFITQSECAVGHSFGSATRYTTVTVLYE